MDEKVIIALDFDSAEKVLLRISRSLRRKETCSSKSAWNCSMPKDLPSCVKSSGAGIKSSSI